jgi:hypothetical protein
VVDEKKERGGDPHGYEVSVEAQQKEFAVWPQVI